LGKIFIIAEAGVNHNGSLELAKRLVDVAAEAGADAVKFQTFKPEKLVSRTAEKAEYQKQATCAEENQFDMLKKLELDENAHKSLFNYAGQRGVEFISTPFDGDSLNFLNEKLNLQRLKISSGEITNCPLLLAAARTGKSILLSVGMATLAEIETALGVLAFGYTLRDEEPTIQGFQNAYWSEAGITALREKVTILHCTTEYPAPFSDVNMMAMETLQLAFGLPVGFSDHTEGIAVSIAAVARGAKVVEKHFTLDKALPGPDHKASLNPDELKAMVTGIRQVEAALGSSVKRPAVSEMKNRPIVRKSLVAACTIKKGELFTPRNLNVKRPGDGISPLYYWEWIGKRAERDYEQDEKVGL